MPVFSELFNTVRSIILGRSTALLNLLALVIIGAIEAFVSSEKLFVCPTKGYSVYGWAFIFGPGVIFLLISLLVRENFRQQVQGCCHSEVGNDRCDRWCPCSREPRWTCNRRIIQSILQSFVIASMWVFMAFLQREYYACAMLGSRTAMETRKLAGISNENEKKEIKLSIEEQLNEFYDESQYIGLVMAAVILAISFTAVTAYYCCYKRPYMSLPKAAKYEKLEAVAAVQAFKDKMKENAEEQGRRQAEAFFSENNPNVLIETYNELRGINDEYANAFPEDNALVIEAQESKQAFDAKARLTAKEKVEVTFSSLEFKNFNQQQVRDQLIERYPIASGDLDGDYVQRNNNGIDNTANVDDIELHAQQTHA